MKSGKPGVNHAEARRFAITQGVVGAGWCLYGANEITDGCPSLNTYLDAATIVYPDDNSLSDAARRIGGEIAVNDFGWMYDTATGDYWCCQISGEFVYREGGEFSLYDLHILRPCRWAKVGPADAVPGAIRRAFAGPFGTVSRLVTAEVAIIEAAELALGLRIATSSQSLFDVASPDDLEDIAALFLQENGWAILPSTAKASMANYEFVMVAPNGRRAGIQVKSGNVYHLDLSVSQDFDTFFVLMANDRATVSGQSDKVVHLKRAEIEMFAAQHWEMLPRRLQMRWPQPQ